MRKSLLAITMVLVIGGAAFPSAPPNISYRGQSSGPLQSGYTVVDSTRGANIYNLTLNAGSANAVMTIYDANALSNGAMIEPVIYEIEVATVGDSRTVDFSTAPIQTFNGVTASVTNGVGYINLER